MTVTGLRSQIRQGSATSESLVAEALESARTEGARLNAFITLLPDRALERARALDSERKSGHDRGPLHGIPIAVKDTFYMKGVRTTDGTRIFENFTPDYDAFVVARLEDAGAVIIGKTNLHELAYGITSSNPHYGAVHNPRCFECIPGGSSGGSGAAIGARIVPIALGTDTGGSIRIPAAYCGTAGLKPTYGAISRKGCFALGATLDHMGPLGSTLEDCEIAFEAMTQPLRPAQAASAVRVGVPVNYFFDNLHPGVAAAVLRARDALADAGCTIEEVRVPDIAKLNTVARIILMCEASALMQKYQPRRDEFGADVRGLLDQGLLLPGVDYVNAQRARAQFVAEFESLFRKIDVLLTPVTPLPAPRIGQATVTIDGREEDVRLASTRLVRGINAIGFPAISVPCGTVEGLPAGAQLVGRPWAESQILAMGKIIEQTMSSEA